MGAQTHIHIYTHTHDLHVEIRRRMTNNWNGDKKRKMGRGKDLKEVHRSATG